MSVETSGRRPVTALAAEHIGKRIRLVGRTYDIVGYPTRIETDGKVSEAWTGAQPYIAGVETTLTMRVRAGQDWTVPLRADDEFEVVL